MKKKKGKRKKEKGKKKKKHHLVCGHLVFSFLRLDVFRLVRVLFQPKFARERGRAARKIHVLVRIAAAIVAVVVVKRVVVGAEGGVVVGTGRGGIGLLRLGTLKVEKRGERGGGGGYQTSWKKQRQNKTK